MKTQLSFRLVSSTLGIILITLLPGGSQPIQVKSIRSSALDHPRLFFDAGDIPALQTQAETTHQEIWAGVKDYVESELGTVPPPTAPVDGDLGYYRSAGDQMMAFAFACVIAQDTDYCDLAKTYLLTYATWDQWGENNWRDLGHAHMLQGNAIAYDWLYTILTPAERQLVREALGEWAYKMYEASASETINDSWYNWWIREYVQNHHWINNGALGMAGLALLEEDDRAQMWVDHASNQISIVQYVLNQIADGSWHEGIEYQSYGLTLSLPFMVNLRKIQGTDIIPHTYLQNYPYWRLYNHLPDSIQFILSYGDFEWNWGNAYQPQNLLRFTAGEYGNGYAEWMAQQLVEANGRWPGIWSSPWFVLEFLYYDANIQSQAPESLSKVRTFTDLEGVIWRTGWESDDLIFGLKAGPYGGRFAFNALTQGTFPWQPPCGDAYCYINIGHDHNDTNSFYLARGRSWLVPERVGVGLSETFYHNTLLIDDQGQYSPPTDAGFVWVLEDSDGFLEATANTPNFDYVAADATRRYSKLIPGIEDVTRHVLFMRPDYFVMLDNLAADGPHQYEWVGHFGESVSVQGNWLRGDAEDDLILGVSIAAPQPFNVTLGDDGRPYARIRPVGSGDDVRLINVLYPTKDAAWSTKPTVTTLADTGNAAVVRVQMNDGSGRVDDILMTYVQPGTTINAGPYSYDGQAAVVTKGGDGRLEKLFVYGCTFLTNQAENRPLITGLNSRAPFEAVYNGQTVEVYYRIPIEPVTLYAPQAQQLTLNGMPWEFTRSGDYITIAPGKIVYLPLIVKE